MEEKMPFFPPGLEILKQRYAWPHSKPDVPPDDHGWFGECNQHVLSLLLNDRTKVVLELGSWLGRSTRFILKKAPNATVLAVDHWLGTKQITDDDPACLAKIPSLYETFLVNCWDHRDRLVPIRRTTIEAMSEMADLGVKPDVIYLDAAHDYESVKADLQKIREVFPLVPLAGDDFSLKWEGVMRAVWEHVESEGCGMILADYAWATLGRWRDGALNGVKR